MKFLKSWRVFESVDQSEVEEIVDILQSKCLDLNDRNFLTEIKPGLKFGQLYAIQNNLNPYDSTLEVIISNQEFYFEEISQDVLEIIDFMGNEDWRLDSINIFRVSYSPEEPKLRGDKLYGWYSGKEIDYPIDKLSLRFKNIR